MVKSLNVAFSVTYIPPTYIGGGQTYIYYLTRELYNLGVKIDVFASEVSVESSEWDWEHAKIHECKSILRVSNTPIMPTLPLKMGKDNSCDLIHTDVPQGFSCDISAFISDVKKKPLIITYHCDLLPSTISRAYSFILRNYTLKRADKIVATTRTYAETSPLLKKFMNKVEIVPMGVDLKIYSISDREKTGKEIREKYEIQDERVLLFVGGLNEPHRYKRVDLLLKTFKEISKKYPDVKLIIVGEGELRSGYESMCNELDVKDNVLFTGYVSNEELPKYYCASNLFVLPSLTREEAFGIVLLEAAACGCVPVCFDIPGPGEVCKNLGGLVVFAENPMIGLKKTISEALSLDLDEIGRICADNVKKYGWNEVAKETLDIYGNVLL